MKKKETEIATNVSSGAEKVEVVEREIKTQKSAGKGKTTAPKTTKTTVKKTAPVSAKGDSALGDSVKTESVKAKEINAGTAGSKAEKESQAAKARVERALKKKEEQAKRKELRLKRAAERAEKRKKKQAEKKALAEKRAAAKKALVEKRAAERKARIEKRKLEKEEAIRERAHAKANKNQENSKKKSQRSKNRRERNHKTEREKGYGGWIAAVVSLGVVSLALATTVTVGAIDMKKNADAALNANKATMYELTGIMEHVDDDLDRIRVSNDKAQQSRILTDLLVQARLAEADLEKLPISAEQDGNIASFINRTAATCERLLGKLRSGEPLTEEDKGTLEGLYKLNHSIREELDGMLEKMTDEDVMSYIKKGEGMMSDVFKKLEDMTLEENRAAFEKAKQERAPKNMPAAPFESESTIDPTRAEELCRGYFSDYKINDYAVTGETVSRGYTAYNVQGYDEQGAMLFAEVDKSNGALLRFDYFTECSGETFDIENAERIAEAFLEKLGYTDLTAVRLRANGSTTDFTYVYEQDGTVYYPDEIRIKVCRTRGIVSGLDTTKYQKNHRDRYEVNPEISLKEASEKLSKKLTVEASRLAVTATQKGEREVYEFFCSYGEEQYFVYVDANTGAEVAILNAKNIQ